MGNEEPGQLKKTEKIDFLVVCEAAKKEEGTRAAWFGFGPRRWGAARKKCGGGEAEGKTAQKEAGLWRSRGALGQEH